MSNYVNRNIAEETLYETIVPFFQWNIQNCLTHTTRTNIHSKVKIIQRAWKRYASIKNVITIEDLFEIPTTNESDLGYVCLYDKIITWTYYFLYRDASEAYLVPEYTHFLIDKLYSSNQITERQNEELLRNYNVCRECKVRKDIALFLGISKNILTPAMLSYVGI